MLPMRSNGIRIFGKDFSPVEFSAQSTSLPAKGGLRKIE